MAMAGAGRVFELCDEKPEVDEGFVELVNVRYNKNNELIETKENTEMWAWKKPAKDGNSAEYTRLAGDVTFDRVDFGYNPDKMVLHDIKMYATPGQKIAFVGSTGASLLMNPSALASLAAAMHSSSLASSLPYLILSMIVPVNRLVS